jgi:hypothetical protein
MIGQLSEGAIEFAAQHSIVHHFLKRQLHAQQPLIALGFADRERKAEKGTLPFIHPDVTDITTLEYHTCNAGAECDQLKRVTNALGHITTGALGSGLSSCLHILPLVNSLHG